MGREEFLEEPEKTDGRKTSDGSALLYFVVNPLELIEVTWDESEFSGRDILLASSAIAWVRQYTVIHASSKRELHALRFLKRLSRTLRVERIESTITDCYLTFVNRCFAY